MSFFRQCTTLTSANTNAVMYGTCISTETCTASKGTADGNCASGQTFVEVFKMPFRRERQNFFLLPSTLDKYKRLDATLGNKRIGKLNML
jgi:hypothetical protein